MISAQAPCFETALGTSLGIFGDDDGVAQALGFSFPFNGTTYTDINVCSNGFVWLGPTPPASNPWDFSPTDTELLTLPARIAPLWTDMYPPGGGTIYYNSFPAGPGVPARGVVTWDQVPLFGNFSVLMTIQLQLDDTGLIHWSIAASGGAPTSALTGFSEGVAATANPIDFTTALPHNTGNFPTVHEWFTAASPIDILGQSHEALPNGTNGYLVVNLPQCQLAGVNLYGAGCPAPQGVAVYELFQATAFDLSNTSLLFLPNGNGSYTIVNGNNTWFSGFTNNLGLADDQSVPVTLPWTFPHAGGSTSTISVSSNGFVWLGLNTNSACCSGNSAAFLSDPMARIAPCWMDLYPPGATTGGVFADFDAATGEYVITWSQVPEYFANPPVDMQVALQPSGIFEIRYLSMTNTMHVALAGYSAGAVPSDPGNSDFSFLPITTPGMSVPLELSASARPVLGTSIALYTVNIDQAGTLGVNVLGVLQSNPGLDLTPFGAPGCSQYVTPASSSILIVSGPTPSMTLAIPNNSALAGPSLYTQSAVFASGVNALGIEFGKGVALLLGAL
ncbi:MAG: hypothetical protein Fur0037_17400 [Planctomycetota bacterium]